MTRIRPGTAAWTKAMRNLQGSADTALDQSMGRKAARLAAKPHVVGSIALDQRLRGGAEPPPQTLTIGISMEWENSRLIAWVWDEGGNLAAPAVTTINGQAHPYDENTEIVIRDTVTTDQTSVVWSVTDANGGFASGAFQADGLMTVGVEHDPEVIGRVRLQIAGSWPDFRIHAGDVNSPVIYEGPEREFTNDWPPQTSGYLGCLVIGRTARDVHNGEQRLIVPLHGPNGEFPPGFAGLTAGQTDPASFPWDAMTTHAQIDGWADAQGVARGADWGQMTLASKRQWLVAYFDGATPWITGN